MLHGPQRDLFEMEFRIPSECADRLASGAADIGIVPSFELTRQDLAIVPGLGIACRGAVRSILLVSKVAAPDIRRLATDTSSRTSVELARVILDHRYQRQPEFLSHAPDLEAMFEIADAALVIGDPALRLPLAQPGRFVYDLGSEWCKLTGLPMVFAVWAGHREAVNERVGAAFRASCRYGMERIEDIVAAEAGPRGFSPDLVRGYLTRNIVHELGPREYEGMDRFLELARR
jgi:chorismate dehydratase